MKKIIIAMLIVASLFGISCSADTNVTVVPENNNSEVTAGDVAKHIALSPFYVVFGGVAVLKEVTVGILTLGLKAVNMVSDDTNSSAIKEAE